MKSKKDELKRALNGKMDTHQKKMLETQLRHIDFLDEEIDKLNEKVKARILELLRVASCMISYPLNVIILRIQTRAPA